MCEMWVVHLQVHQLVNRGLSRGEINYPYCFTPQDLHVAICALRGVAGGTLPCSLCVCIQASLLMC